MSLFLIPVAFLLGSVPSGLIVTWLHLGRDVREFGSGNIGASNVASAAGWQSGALVAAFDVAKGVAPVLAMRLVGGPDTLTAAVALAAVLGHDFSIFLRFHGGKGVATTFGVFLPIAPIAAAVALFVWIGALLVWRYASVASLAALITSPVFVALTTRSFPYTVLAIILACLGVMKHWENIVRLHRGEERSVKGWKSTDRNN